LGGSEEFTAGDELGIDFEEKAVLTIFEKICVLKYDSRYPEEQNSLISKSGKIS